MQLERLPAKRSLAKLSTECMRVEQQQLSLYILYGFWSGKPA